MKMLLVFKMLAPAARLSSGLGQVLGPQSPPAPGVAWRENQPIGQAAGQVSAS
jgi:hypothetical protein